METTKTGSVFNLPYGYLDPDGVIHAEAEIREMTGEEEDIIADGRSPIISRIDRLMARCLKRIGNVTDAGRITLIVRDLAMPDRLRLLIGIRVLSVGPEYHYKAKCQECDSENRFTTLLDTLQVKYPEDRGKRQHVVTLPSGLTAKFHLLTGKDEGKLTASRRDPKDTLSAAILVRLEELNGKPPDMAAVKRLGMRDRHALRTAFGRIENCIETSADLTCPSCANEFKAEIDFGQGGFFIPATEEEDDR